MTDRLAWTLRRLGRVKGDTLLLDDDGKRFEPKRVRVLVKRAQFNAGLEPTGNAHILHHTFSTTRFVHAWPWRGPPRRSSRHSTGHYRRALHQRSLRRRHWSLAVFGPRPRRMRNPPTNGGLMEREKGFESGLLPVFSWPYAAADVALPRSMRRADVSDPPDPAALPSPIPSFLEACARLASEAAMRGDFARARALIEKAARVTELPRRSPKEDLL
jgi:hypothetical protein